MSTVKVGLLMLAFAATALGCAPSAAACFQTAPSADSTQLVYEFPEGRFLTPEMIEGYVNTIERRMALCGMTDVIVRTTSSTTILVQVPNRYDINAVKQLIGRPAVLQIVERICADGFTAFECAREVPGSFEDHETGLRGEDMARASAGQDRVTGEPVLLFELNRDAARQFAVLTQRLFSTNNSTSPDQLAFFLDGEMLVSHLVRSPILTGNGQISGRFTSEDVRRLAIQLESGRLPVRAVLVEEKRVNEGSGSSSTGSTIPLSLGVAETPGGRPRYDRDGWRH